MTPPERLLRDIADLLRRGDWVITSPYGVRKNPLTGAPGQVHKGIDLAPAKPDATRWLRFAAIGDVRFQNNAHAHQNGMAVFWTWNDWRIVMIHLRTIALTGIAQAGWVYAVEIGSTGLSLAPHLHLEVHRLRGGGWQIDNPADYLR